MLHAQTGQAKMCTNSSRIVAATFSVLSACDG